MLFVGIYVVGRQNNVFNILTLDNHMGQPAYLLLKLNSQNIVNDYVEIIINSITIIRCSAVHIV